MKQKNRIEKFFEEKKSDLNEPKVLFRKWSDFFIGDDNDDEDENDDYLDSEKHGFIALSPMGGPIPSNIPDFEKLFNLWLMETNFGITENMFYEVDNILGVESIDKVSPYKLRISIGKLFDEGLVQGNISKVLKKCLNVK